MAEITTIEGLGTAANPHPLQLSWVKHGVIQCGFCTPGFILSAKALLDKNPSPERQEVRDWFTKNKNLCRCTGYKQLVDAVMDAAGVMRGEKDIRTLKLGNHDIYPVWIFSERIGKKDQISGNIFAVKLPVRGQKQFYGRF